MKIDSPEAEILLEVAHECLEDYPADFHRSESCRRIWKAFLLGREYEKCMNARATEGEQ